MTFHKKGRAVGETPYTCSKAVPCHIHRQPPHYQLCPALYLPVLIGSGSQASADSDGKARKRCRVKHFNTATHPVEDVILQTIQIEQAPARVQNAREVAALDRSFHAPGRGTFPTWKMAVLGVALATSGSRGYRLLFFYPNGQRVVLGWGRDEAGYWI